MSATGSWGFEKVVCRAVIGFFFNADSCMFVDLCSHTESFSLGYGLIQICLRNRASQIGVVF